VPLIHVEQRGSIDDFLPEYSFRNTMVRCSNA
jgi:hypothetical protein